MFGQQKAFGGQMTPPDSTEIIIRVEPVKNNGSFVHDSSISDVDMKFTDLAPLSTLAACNCDHPGSAVGF